MAAGPERLRDALLELDGITRRLRRECPWDREQDERSIVPHTVEEAYELADAAHSGDDAKLLDELGDVLFQVYFLSLMMEERSQGDLAAVAEASVRKLVRRHPHIFGEDGQALDGLPTNARTASEVKQNWDAIKDRERGSTADAEIAANLPALTYARKVRRTAAQPAPTTEEATDNVRRALDAAAREAGGAQLEGHGSDALYGAVGDLLLAAVELATALRVDPEIALRRTAEAR